MVHGRLLTLENIQKRRIQELLRCALCKSLEETHFHLLFGFPYSKKVWKHAFRKIESRLVQRASPFLEGDVHNLVQKIYWEFFEQTYSKKGLACNARVYLLEDMACKKHSTFLVGRFQS
jgi:hypothetical protein